MPDNSVCEGEFAYPFPDRPIEAEPVILPKVPKESYCLDSGAFDNKGLYAYHLHIPQKAKME